MTGKKTLFIEAVLLIMLNIFLIGLLQYKTASGRDDLTDTLSKSGSRGMEVTLIQSRLKDLGFFNGKVDGVYGAQTTAAVKWFQSRWGLTADGVAGEKTLRALKVDLTGMTLRRGSTGLAVRTLQDRMRMLGYLPFPTDGIYGKNTAYSVLKYQKDHGFTADGIAGPYTLKALGLATTTAAGAGGTAGATRPAGNNQSTSNSNDYNLLARIISAEARGEPYIGQVAVGAVIMNRVKHPSFPNTIAGVIYQPGAFTAITDGQMSKPVIDSAKKAAQDCLNGSNPVPSCIYYYNPAKTTNKWMLARPTVTTIGKHVFTR